MTGRKPCCGNLWDEATGDRIDTGDAGCPTCTPLPPLPPLVATLLTERFGTPSRLS